MEPRKIQKLFYILYIIFAAIIYWIVIMYIKRSFPELGFSLNPDADKARGLVYLIELSLSLLYLFLGIQFHLNTIEREPDIQTDFFKSISLFFLCVGTAQGLSVINSLTNHKYFNIPNITFDGIVVYAILLALIGLTRLVRNMDKHIRANIMGAKKKSKGNVPILTIMDNIGISALLIVLINYGLSLGKTASLIIFLIGGVIFLLIIFYLIALYFIIGIKTSGAVRKNSFIISSGYTLMFFGLLLHMVRESIPFTYNYIVFLIMNLVGVALVIYGYLNISPEE